MGKSLEEFRNEFNQVYAELLDYYNFLKQGFSNKLFKSEAEKTQTALTYYKNNESILKDQLEDIAKGPKSSDKEDILQWIKKNKEGLALLENEDLCQHLEDKGILEIRQKTTHIRKTSNAWIGLYKNNMNQLINLDGTDNLSNARSNTPQKTAEDIKDAIDIFYVIPNKVNYDLWGKSLEDNKAFIDKLVNSKEHSPVYEALAINEISSKYPYETQLQVNCMKAMKNLQPYFNTDSLFNKFADNQKGHTMIKQVLEKGTEFEKKHNTIAHFKTTTIDQDKHYIGILLDPKNDKAGYDPIIAVNFLSIVADKYANAPDGVQMLKNCKKAIDGLLDNKELAEYAASKEGSDKLRGIYKASGLAEDRIAEKEKGKDLFLTAIVKLDYFQNIRKEAQQASGTFHDSDQYKQFRTMAENYASLAETVFNSYDEDHKENFTLDLDALPPKAKELAAVVLGEENSGNEFLNKEQTFKLLKKFNDALKTAARTYEEYKMEDHTLNPDKEPGKKRLNKDDIRKINLVRKIRDMKPLPQDLYKNKENNKQKDAPANNLNL